MFEFVLVCLFRHVCSADWSVWSVWSMFRHVCVDLLACCGEGWRGRCGVLHVHGDLTR